MLAYWDKNSGTAVWCPGNNSPRQQGALVYTHQKEEVPKYYDANVHETRHHFHTSLGFIADANVVLKILVYWGDRRW